MFEDEKGEEAREAAAPCLCGACGAEVGAAKFCPECATPVEPPAPKCAACGHRLEDTPKFCPECGAELPVEI